MREKGKKGGTRIGVDGKIPWNEETGRGGYVIKA